MILDTVVQAYLHGLRVERDPLLLEMEAYAAEHDVPIAEPELAQLVAMLARANGARLVLEVGLAIGYTALQVARALPEFGKVVSLERDMVMASMAGTYLRRDPAGARIEILLGDARDTLAELHETFDLAFIDADKIGYAEYVELVLPRLRRTGLIVIDNLLMDGLVARGSGDDHWSQASVAAAVSVNRQLADDPDVNFVLLPLGDGVGIVQRR